MYRNARGVRKKRRLLHFSNRRFLSALYNQLGSAPQRKPVRSAKPLHHSYAHCSAYHLASSLASLHSGKHGSGGRAIASFAYSFFRPLKNRSGLHETQPVGRQSSRRPLHIKRVCPLANSKRSAEPLHHSRAHFPVCHAQVL